MRDDLISRQAAIDALKKAYWDSNIQSAKNDPCIVDAMADWAIRQVKALPTIEPRAKGAWVEVYDSSVGGHNNYSCSNCGLTIVTNPDYLKKHKFCFACGADMREVTE